MSEPGRAGVTCAMAVDAIPIVSPPNKTAYKGRPRRCLIIWEAVMTSKLTQRHPIQATT